MQDHRHRRRRPGRVLVDAVCRRHVVSVIFFLLLRSTFSVAVFAQRPKRNDPYTRISHSPALASLAFSPPKREELCQYTECATKSPSVHEHRTKWKSAMRFYPSVPYTLQPSHTKIIMRQNVRCKEQHAERFIFFCSFLLLLLLDGMVWYTAHTRSA